MTIPTYPVGRHRGARRSLLGDLLLALLPFTNRHQGRHRVGHYRGRHTTL